MTDDKNKPSKRLIAPELPSGFRDYSPAETIAKQAMIDTIRTTFELFGFDPLETSSVQRTEVLTGGEEDSGKIIFNVKGSQEKESDSSLRFDLTVPLARFMAANQDIPKPFKRYQIGTVWRGERPQAGRYREFMQADVDIVGSSSLDADAEIATIIFTIFKNLGIERFVINYNNRKILDRLPEAANFPLQQLWNALRIIDKEDKIGIDGVVKELSNLFGEQIAADIRKFVFEISNVRLDLTNEGRKTDWGEINDQLEIAGFDVSKFIPKRSLVRRLSYYTGSVFEVLLLDAPEIGSVCGGGRYDELVAQFTGQNIPAVGVSFGVDRLFAALEKLGKLKKQGTKTRVLILQLDEELQKEYSTMAQELRDAGINTALYLGDDRAFQAQLAYAVKKEIPFVVIYGEEEKKRGIVSIKNLNTREQKEILREQTIDYCRKVSSSP